MNNFLSKFVLVAIIITTLIASTPFIAYFTNNGPSRLWPALAAMVFLVLAYILWSKSSKFSKTHLLHFGMAINFLSLIFISISWIGIPFIDAIFLILGNVAFIFFIVAIVLGSMSYFKYKKGTV